MKRVQSEWISFIDVLEAQGVSFDQVKYTSNPVALIHSTGFTDPLTVAILETEWKRRVPELRGSCDASNARGTTANNTPATMSTYASLHTRGMQDMVLVGGSDCNTHHHSQYCPQAVLTATATASGSNNRAHNLDAHSAGMNILDVNHVALTGSSATSASVDPTLLKRTDSMASRRISPHSPPGAAASQQQPVQLPGSSACSSSLLQVDYTQLHRIPEEIQDVIVATEVLHAALGCGGALLSTTPDGGFAVSPFVPPALQSLCQTILPVADAFVMLQRVEAAEIRGRSLVAMAIGEVVSEMCTSYAAQVTKLHRDYAPRPMPLMGVVSDVMRLGHPMVRLRHILPLDLMIRSVASKPSPRLASSVESDEVSNGVGYAHGYHLSSSTMHHNSNTTGTNYSTSASTAFLGARLLNHLYLQADRCAGSSEDEELITLLLRRGMVPYLRMLYRWMHEGVVADPLNEFFVVEATADPMGSAPNTTTYAALSRRTLTAAASTFYRRTVGTLFPDTVYGAEYANRVRSQSEVHAFERRFSISKMAVPVFLEKPSRIVKMIFFSGKYCCLLREYDGSLPAFGDAATRMLSWTDADDLHRRIQESFELASGTMIRLLMSNSVDLMGHLASLKTFFLQDRGDWVTDFLDSADALLRSPPDGMKVHSIRVLLQSSLARCTRHDPYFDRISCSFAGSTLEEYIRQTQHQAGEEVGAGAGATKNVSSTTAETNNHGSGSSANSTQPPPTTTITRATRQGAASASSSAAKQTNADRCVELLQLDMDLQWPLTLVLEVNVIRRFNVIFRLLLWIRVAERGLCALWHNNEILARFSVAYGLKHQFVQFLRQFQFYAAHFVMEPLWSRMMERISQADSVFAISQALTDFFCAVELGLVLSSAHRFRSLATILDLVARFCEVGRHSSTATMPLIEATLHSVEDNFLRALSELASPVGQDYTQLLPLLTWIDFSSFYDRKNIYHVQRSITHASSFSLNDSRSAF